MANSLNLIDWEMAAGLKTIRILTLEKVVPTVDDGVQQ